MSSTDPRLNNLVLPEDLKAKLTDAARRSNRSATAEVISRLEETFSRDDIAQAKDARDALLVELSTALRDGLEAAKSLNEVQVALQKVQRLLDIKTAEEIKPRR